MAISTNGVILTRLAGALYNQQLSNATYNEVLTAFNSPTALSTLANYLISTDFASKTDLQIATTLVSNLSLTSVTGLDNWIAAQLTAAGTGNKGAKIISMLNDFSNMSTADATYGAAVTAFNTKIDASQALSQATGNTGGTFTATGTTNKSFTLTTGIDSGSAFVGGTGNDTFAGSTSAGALTFSSLDVIDGGAGTDTLNIAATVAVDTTALVGASVSNIENASITSTGAVVATTTAWTGLTSLATASTGNSTVTSAVTTDIAATVASPTGAGAALINGGKAVTLSMNDTAAADTATGNTVSVGVTTQAAGAVTVTASETHPASANGAASALATGTIRVDGGTSVVVNSIASGAAGDNAGDVLTIGQVTVNGKGTATSVSVTQSAATKTWAAAGDLYKITNGVVAITDTNTATKSDAITTVTLANFGASTIAGNALTTLNLTGGSSSTLASGTVGISQSASLTTAAPTTLAINMTSGSVGVITDTNDQYTTLNVTSAAAATIAGLDFTNATSLTVAGAGVTTISAQTDLAKVTTITSTGGGLSLSGTLPTGTLFTGGAGKETVTVGATTKAITTLAGDDAITISATALGTGGSVDAGDGSDTLTMTAANAVTASATTTFETAISNFEKLSLGVAGASGTVNLANIDDLNDVAVAGVSGGFALTLSGATTGINLRFADATQTSTLVTLANNGTADVANVFLTTADEASTLAAVDLTGFETINIASADTDTNTTAASNAITSMTAGNATTVVVTGNAGLALAAGFAGTKVTSFNASAVTAGAVTYTTGALAAAATITGGAGADTLSGASAAIAGVTISGGAGNDTITGSATKASTLNGDAGNDSITGGAAADVIDGGVGTNTYVFSSTTVVEQTGSSATTGVVINLGATALSQSDVFTATAAYLATVSPSVAATSSTYLFAGESSTNVSVVDTLANIQNATGTELADYIVGSDSANALVGADGIDVLSGGAGNDFMVGDVSGNDDVDTLIGGAGDDTYQYADAGEADQWVEAAAGGTDTIYVAADLSLSGLAVGTTLAGVAANGSLSGFEQLALGAGVDVVFNSAQVTGLTMVVGETAAGTSSITVNASAATSPIDLSGFSTSASTYTSSTGASAALTALTSGTDLVYINGDTGINAIVGSVLADVITAAGGVDTINITNGGADKIVTGSAAADADVITGFTKANDILDLSAPLAAATLTIGTQVAFDATTKATNIAAVDTAADTDAEVYYIKNTAGAAGVMSLAEIEAAIVAGDNATGQATIIIDNGTDTLVYFDLAAQTDATGGAGLILVATLVGITGATALATGDLISV